MRRAHLRCAFFERSPDAVQQNPGNLAEFRHGMVIALQTSVEAPMAWLGAAPQRRG
jgi:hypothetical protein